MTSSIQPGNDKIVTYPEIGNADLQIVHCEYLNSLSQSLRISIVLLYSYVFQRLFLCINSFVIHSEKHHMTLQDGDVLFKSYH